MFFNPTNPEFSGKIVCADFQEGGTVITRAYKGPDQ